MRSVLLMALCLLAAACGSSPVAPPPVSTFSLTAGAYRLSFAGTSCVLSTSDSPVTPNPGTVELQVMLAESLGGFALTAAGQPISGQLQATPSLLTGTLAGSAAVGAMSFQTGLSIGDAIALSGVARDGDRFEGQLTTGRTFFTVSDAGGSSTASCAGAAFTLRRA